MSWVPEQDAMWARQIYKDLRAKGYDAEAVIKQCGISRSSLNKKNGTIPFEKHCALFGHAAQLTGQDCYGLLLGTRMDPRDAGLLGYLGLASANIKDAIENLCRYARVASDVTDLEMVVADGVGSLSVRLRIPAAPFGYDQESEFSVSLFLRACKVFTGKSIKPIRVGFSHSRTTSLRDFKQAFNCPVAFGQDRERVFLDRETLMSPIVTADDRLLEVLKGYGDDILARHANQGPDFKHQVERWIVDLLPRGTATAATIAMELGMSERTLSRRLSDFGLTFKDLLADVRRDLSLKYVVEPELSLKQAAFLLGYSEPSAFSHAFKRWTGETPAQVRQASIGG